MIDGTCLAQTPLRIPKGITTSAWIGYVGAVGEDLVMPFVVVGVTRAQDHFEAARPVMKTVVWDRGYW